MTHKRLQAGDMVVLNGHRLTVAANPHDPEAVDLYEDGMLAATLPAVFVPNPEPCSEPPWEPGDVVRDAEGRVYRRTERGRPWQAMGHDVGENVLVRPLTQLVPDPLSNPAVRSVGERAAAMERAAIMAAARHFAESQPPAQALALHQFVSVLACGLPSNAAPQSDDHRDSWDTFGTKRGVVMAESEALPLTPGTTVAHRDGRLGVYEMTGSIDGGLGWRPFGKDTWACSPPGSLRPVTLVEKPEREAFASLLMPMLQGSGDARRRNVGRVFDALFGEPS